MQKVVYDGGHGESVLLERSLDTPFLDGWWKRGGLSHWDFGVGGVIDERGGEEEESGRGSGCCIAIDLFFLALIFHMCVVLFCSAISYVAFPGLVSPWFGILWWRRWWWWYSRASITAEPRITTV